MKFGAQWKQRVAELPPSLRDAAISYKAWKKRVKRELPAPDEFLGTLKDECDRVNRSFLETARRARAERDRNGRWWRRASCGGCDAAAAVAPGDDADDADAAAVSDAAKAYAFAVLNRTCVYKLCKKYDKARRASLDGAPDAAASPWFRRALGAGAYAFLSSVELKRLELELSGTPATCPVCLDETPSAAAPAAFILACGHVTCLACVQDLYGVRRLRGTLYNRLSYGRYRAPGARCPLCRAPDPIGVVSALNVWPPERAGALLEVSGPARN